MKFLLFGLAVLVAGASAFPESVELQGRQSDGELFVENLKNAIRAIQRFFIRNDLDPLQIDRFDRFFIRFPYINVQLWIDGLKFEGLSNIAIHELQYSNLFSRLRYDLELPELDFIIADSGLSGTVLSTKIGANLAGRLTISNIRLAGEAYVRADIITGSVTITELVARFSLGGIKSKIILEVLEKDLGEWLNDLLNYRIPGFLENNENDINRVIGNVIKFVVQIWLNVRPRPSA